MTPIPSADRYEIITEAIRYSGATIARNRAIKISSTTTMVMTTMKSEVMVVIVTGVPERDRKSRHRYLGVGQRGVRLSPSGGVRGSH